jgi:hypothetical protein
MSSKTLKKPGILLRTGDVITMNKDPIAPWEV